MMIPKFRAWDKESQQMCNVGALYFSRDYELEAVSVHLHSGFVTNINLGDCILMQSTGLKDKNGMDIFEGDVVEVIWNFTTFIGVVVYDQSEAGFKATNEIADYGKTFMYLTGNDSVEVIGNIYKDTELLGG